MRGILRLRVYVLMMKLPSTQLLDPPNMMGSRHKKRFAVCGSLWEVSCDSPHIMASIRELFKPADSLSSPPDLSLSLSVDSSCFEEERWLQPYFRGMDHLVYAAYGPGSSMLINLRTCHVIGSFSPAMACDSTYWKQVILPVLLGVVSQSIGVTPLHCACLVNNGNGLLLGGFSGAGKSTLALSLASQGLAYLSDDWTYFSNCGSDLRAWGLPIPVKLLPDAVKYFPSLSRLEPHVSLNGELAFEVDPVETFGVGRALTCAPRWLVFVERIAEPRATFTKISSAEAASRFASELETLPTSIADLQEVQLDTIAKVVDRECWVLRHGLPPDALARELLAFCEN